MTTAPHWFGSVDWVLFAGQVIVGGCVSLTVTVNEQLGPGVVPLGCATVPPPPVVQVTVVMPFGKKEPEAGVQFTVPHEPVVVGGA